jgi:hypothetical protein
LENEIQLSPENYPASVLYHTISEINPDVLIIDLLWFPLYHCINTLKCKKIFLCHFVYDRFFSIPYGHAHLTFNSNHFDRLLAIEPFACGIPMEQINPIILRNKNEILSREDALEKLGLNGKGKNCLYAFNHHPGDFEKYREKYSYLENSGYHMVYTTNYQGGIFPIVDYFNAFDFVVCGAGYNIFWEVIYFDKEAVFENFPLVFSSTEYRIDKYQEHYFEENGADQLVSIMLNL